ncbi:MAG: hypothetical protein HFI26_11860 [Lachnospiraceae bacterium]|jgi:hypothetical protein|nr:hypothetical protein [Lachnospiraceae bacterium]
MAEDEVKEIDAQKEDSEEVGDLPRELSEILEDVPKEVRHEVKRMVAMSMQMGGVISPQLELMKKMTTENVTEFLQGQREVSNNQFKESRDNKIFLVIVLLMVLIFVTALVILLKGNPDMLEKVLYTLGGLVAGLFGGYGYGKSKRDD